MLENLLKKVKEGTADLTDFVDGDMPKILMRQHWLVYDGYIGNITAAYHFYLTAASDKYDLELAVDNGIHCRATLEERRSDRFERIHSLHTSPARAITHVTLKALRVISMNESMEKTPV